MGLVASPFRAYNPPHVQQSDRCRMLSRTLQAVGTLLLVTSCLAYSASCGEHLNESTTRCKQELECSAPELRDEAWICHHPGTEFHNKECVDGIYPDGCYKKGRSNAFCWRLTIDDCQPQKTLFGELVYEDWQEEHCQVLIKEPCEH